MSFLDTSCFYLHQTFTYSVLLNLLCDDDGHFENVQKRKEINSLSNAKDQMPKVLTLKFYLYLVLPCDLIKNLFLGLGTRTQLAMALFPEEVSSDLNTWPPLFCIPYCSFLSQVQFVQPITTRHSMFLQSLLSAFVHLIFRVYANIYYFFALAHQKSI